jgi:cytochrome c556
MKRASLVGATISVVVAATGLAADPDPDKPGWTGLSNPRDEIAARQGLMAEMERLMEPIDSYTIGQAAEPESLRSAAQTISRILAALPHLFPPTTNLYDPKAEEPVTIALPAIWDSFPAFYAFAEAASNNAAAMAGKSTPDELRDAAASLRAACDACHAPFLRPYVPETVDEGDTSFDFNSVFESEPGK